MFIKFNDGFESYDEGTGKVFLKENEPFELTLLEGERLLEVKGSIFDGQTAKGKPKLVRTNVFVKDQPKESVLPEDFPHRDDLERNGIFGFEQLAGLARDDIFALEGIGNVKTDAIVEAVEKHKEKQ